MAFNRDSTLRKAEKLLRQGRLDAAIAEYEQVVKHQPKDWNTTNTLGDLYVRAGHVDSAVKRYASIADHLAAEGFFPRASAVYKKILKIKPDDEYALLQLAEIAARQGLLVDAKKALTAVAERRRARGDRRGAAEIRMRVAALDPSDTKARLAGARAAAELGETPAALAQLKGLADDLEERGRHEDAIKILTEAAEISPGDAEIGAGLMRLHLAAGNPQQARQYAQSADQLKRVAADLQASGQTAQALDLLAAAVALNPDDGDLAATVMRLYLEAGEPARAREYARSSDEFRQVAADLQARGRTTDAIRLLTEVLAASPEDAELAGMLVDLCLQAGDAAGARRFARTTDQLRRVAEHMLAIGQRTEAVGLLGEIAEAAPDDDELAGRLFELCLEAGDAERARRYVRTSAQGRRLADAYRERGDTAEATECLAGAAALDPDDGELSDEVARRYVEAGDLEKAREYARAPDVLKQVAVAFRERGQTAQTLDLLEQVARLDPADVETRTELARAYLDAGDSARAAGYLAREAAGADADLLWSLAAQQVRGEDPEQALALLEQLLAAHPERRNQVVLLGCSVADVSAELAYRIVDLAVRVSVGKREWAEAAAALNELVNRQPGHVPALMRLVEVCVDGGLEATLFSAQGQLADAYLAAGQGAEARTIAEDLVAREPWDRANIERFRRALTLLGEKDVDQIIADRLSGEAPFVSTALSPAFVDEAAPEAAAQAARRPATPATSQGPAPDGQRAGRADDSRAFELGAAAVDIGFLTEAAGAPVGDAGGEASAEARADRAPAEAPPAPEVSEVDLSPVLDTLKPGVSGRSAAGGPGPEGAKDLEGVFQDFRDEVSRENLVSVALQHQKLAQTYLEMGMEEEAVKSLEIAVRAPRLRFEAASMLARLHLKRGEAHEAIEWFERAAEAPAPTREASRALLYDLADTLEVQGETVRALAVFLELQAEAGEYRDIAARLQRLSDVQMRG